MVALLTHAAAVALAAMLLFSGADKWVHWDEGVAELSALHMPFPACFAAATIITQLVGGAAVALGVFAAAGAALLALFTAAATVLGHRFWLSHGQAARHELTTALEHVAIVGGLVLVIAGHGFVR
jgi:putative oxidoreductase